MTPVPGLQVSEQKLMSNAGIHDARPERPPALDGPRRPALGAGAAGGLNTRLCSLPLTPGRRRWGGVRPETGSA